MSEEIKSDDERKNEILYKDFIKSVKVEQNVLKVIGLLSYTSVFIGEYFIFKNCITDLNLINIISLGAILATFGSAILSVALITENDLDRRIMANVDILFNDIVKTKPWKRWQFLGRDSLEKHYDKTTTKMKLYNPSLKFDIGSHKIEIYIPTVKEDFYDLPSFKCFWLMKINNKHFKTNASNKRDKVFKDSAFDSWSNYVMGWDCLHDTWRSIIKYKFSRYLLKLGCWIVFVSLFHTFLFNQISEFVLAVIG